MIHIGFEKITPTPLMPTGVTASALAEKEWESKAKAVVEFKSFLKEKLRSLQKGRCCYCRRLLGDMPDVHLEHFIEKSAFGEFKFEICNLALSCSTCNTHKNSRYTRLRSKLTKWAVKKTGNPSIKIYQCPGLSGTPNISTPLSSHAYRWVHPHFDSYSDHIVIHKGWIFRFHTPKGRRTVNGLKLNLLGEVERRARLERLASKNSISRLLVACIDESDNEKLSKVISEVLGLLMKK